MRGLGSMRGLPVVLCLCLGVSLAAAPAASAEVEWQSETWVRPTYPVPGQAGWVHVTVTERGSSASSASQPTVAKVVLPAGISRPTAGLLQDESWSCLGATVVTCSTKLATPPYTYLSNLQASRVQSFNIPVTVSPSASGVGTITTTVSGGGAAASVVETDAITFSDEPLGFGFVPGSLAAGAYDSADNDYLQAGGHPEHASAAFQVNLNGSDFLDGTVAGGRAKNVVVDLPPGFVGDPSAVPQCAQADFEHFNANSPPKCAPETQVGVAYAYTPTIATRQSAAVYNMEPPGDQPAQFAFASPGGKVVVEPSVRSDGDYGITMTVRRITEGGDLWRSNFVIWGYPMDPSHDAQRCDQPNPVVARCVGYDPRALNNGTPDLYLPHTSSTPRQPFLTLPTQCATQPQTKLRIDSWLNPVADIEDASDPRWAKYTVTSPRQTGCDQLDFAPSITLRPDSKQADSPTGLVAHLNIPQQQDPDQPATAHLKKAVVTLPAGVGISPSQANGVDACSPGQIGLVSAPGQTPIRFDNAAPNCPTAAKIGFAKVETPVLPNALHGELFLASQNQNPFGSEFAVYMIVREPSIQVKLAGLVELDRRTGQIKTTFDQNPQLPFSDLTLTFFDGPRAPLATPQTCGTYSSHSEFSPWSAADPNNPTAAEIVAVDDPFQVSEGASGGPCASSKAQLPFNLGLSAGSRDPLAGAHSPFSMRITRGDGNQEIDRLELKTPEGFSASLKGIPFCSEAQIAAAQAKSGKAEQAAASCPPASQIGTTLVGAGAGDSPFYVGGKVYLSGPYKGAPLSLAVVVPAIAGPFDLGVQVVRTALQVDPRTAQIDAVTDPLPQLLDGVPLRIRDIRVNVDRPGFALNPTDCAEQQVSARVFGTGGAVTDLRNRFQVGGCSRLGFKPKLNIRLKGGTKRNDHPALTATLTARPGDANIDKAVVTLPHSAFLEQGHINTVCTRVQFAAAACPKGSVYGFARAFTPLLDQPLEGPVYLRSSDHALPDMVAALHGTIDIDLVGRIDSVKARIRSSFEGVPDAPVSKFVLSMQGGRKGLIVNSRDLCAHKSSATAAFGAQNGKTRKFKPIVRASCAQAEKRGKKHAKRRASADRLAAG